MWRSAYIGDAAAGHAADAWQRVDAVLLRLLHIRHRRRPAVGRTTAQPLLPRPTGQRVSRRVSLADIMSLFAITICSWGEIKVQHRQPIIVAYLLLVAIGYGIELWHKVYFYWDEFKRMNVQRVTANSSRNNCHRSLLVFFSPADNCAFYSHRYNKH